MFSKIQTRIYENKTNAADEIERDREIPLKVVPLGASKQNSILKQRRHSCHLEKYIQGYKQSKEIITRVVLIRLQACR